MLTIRNYKVLRMRLFFGFIMFSNGCMVAWKLLLLMFLQVSFVFVSLLLQVSFVFVFFIVFTFFSLFLLVSFVLYFSLVLHGFVVFFCSLYYVLLCVLVLLQGCFVLVCFSLSFLYFCFCFFVFVSLFLQVSFVLSVFL